MIDLNNILKKSNGAFQDTIYHKNGEIEVLSWDHNILVNNFTHLIAALFIKASGFTGLGYWAVGTGGAGWTDSSFPEAAVTDSSLVSELGRKAISSSDMVFLDGSGEISATPTSIIKVQATFGTTECNGNWREFGIFGGDATTSLNSGIMINHKNHKLQTKTSDASLTRKIIFTLNP